MIVVMGYEGREDASCAGGLLAREEDNGLILTVEFLLVEYPSKIVS